MYTVYSGLSVPILMVIHRIISYTGVNLCGMQNITQNKAHFFAWKVLIFFLIAVLIFFLLLH